MKKAVLVFPRPISEMPNGFAYLNTVLKAKGYETKAIVNTFKHYYTDEDIIHEIQEFEPDVVGFNLGTLSLLSTYELIKKVKDLGFFIIAGGPHATTRPEEVLRNRVDIVVRNEGEVTLAELCDNNFSNLSSILGISYKENGKIIRHNPQRPYIKDLKDLPKPDFSCFDIEKFLTSDGVPKGLHRIYCSRGCPGLCEFCDSAIFGHQERYRTLDVVMEEIEFRHKTYGIESFVIADDTFTFSKRYVKEFCKRIKELNLPIVWSCSTRANMLNDEILAIMKDAGCYLIGFGIESGDEYSLKMMKKGVTLEQCNKAIEMVAKYDMRIFVNLMVGFPWETEESVQNTIDYIKRHFNKVYVYQVSGSLCPYPNTGVYENYKEQYDIQYWWLRPEYQNFGQQIHQNSTEPYKVNTFYQRKLYDDTYIWEEKFFTYSKGFKKKVKEMAFLIGKRNLLNDYPNKVKRCFIYSVCKLSRFVYEINPNIEKFLVGKIVDIFHPKSNFHNRMPLGAVAKKEALK